MNSRLCTTLGVFGVSVVLAAGTVLAADHTDVPQNAAGATVARPDAQVTDFYSFVAGNKLVMILNVNPSLPFAGVPAPPQGSYEFPTDVVYRLFVDNHSEILHDDPVRDAEFGGEVADPSAIGEDVVFEVTFAPNGNKAQLAVIGASSSGVRVFTGKRAESFIFSPFVRNNVASIVVEAPLSSVVAGQPELVTWGTASVELPEGPFTELGGRALYSQSFPALNALHPSQHDANGFIPDVVIIDTSAPTLFPNGRALADDVVTIADDFTLLGGADASVGELEADLCTAGAPTFPCPVPVSATADDVEIKGNYPYMGAPHGQGQLPEYLQGN